MTWLLLAGGAAFVVAGFYTLLAFNNLSPYGLQNMAHTFFWWPKIFAGREHFTDRGWRYRNLALWFSAIWPLAIVALAVHSCGQA
ncbi:MAG TPA: hypothetical protein VNM37_03430 [Candidatus Dormibacteraeota bacterium]|nr:hypothetical protein [Candidatus Dormibacteraeota bacterium]